MRKPLSTTVNGVQRSNEVEPRTLLVHYLREVLGLTGTHVGCDTSQCGACTVLVDGEATKSCSVLALQVDGRLVETIESVAPPGGGLDPIQKAFIQEHGLQCGYCTPGFIMATKYLLSRNPAPTPDEIRAGLDGNLCRCTGYINIIKAVQTAAIAVEAAAGDGARITSGGGS
jgi:carbon-monoxide dehydrogenase small subunit